MHEKDEKYIQNVISKYDGKRCLQRPRCKWEDISKVDLVEIQHVVVDWIDLAQDRDQWQVLLNMVTNLWVP
jgi:hypothetical protein